VILLPVLSECFHSIAVGCAQFSFTMDMGGWQDGRRWEGEDISRTLYIYFVGTQCWTFPCEVSGMRSICSLVEQVCVFSCQASCTSVKRYVEDRWKLRIVERDFEE
jgi:hypothetical protein